MAFTALSMFFVYYLLSGWLVGGRWDLNEHIAFAYRLSEGNGIYANGKTDLYFPTSPYFPGVGYLSYLFQLLGLTDPMLNNTVMIFCSVLIGFLSVYCLYKITLKLYPDTHKDMLAVFISLIYLTHFKDYMFYMKEFKPDTILLVIAFTIFLVFESGKLSNALKALIIGGLLFICVFFKQSFFLIYIGFTALILFKNTYTLKIKLGLLFATGAIGLLALFFVFSIPNLYYFAVESMGEHQFLDLGTIFYYISKGLIYDSIFILLLIFFLFKNYKRLFKLNFENAYLCFAILWFVFSIISTIKDGGNTGNFEVGLIVLVPFAVRCMHDILNPVYANKLWQTIAMAALVFLSVYYAKDMRDNYYSLKDQWATDKLKAAFIEKTFANKNGFVDGNTYIISQKAHIKSLTEFETLGHFNTIPNYKFSTITAAIESKTYDLIYLSKMSPTRFDSFKDTMMKQAIKTHYMIYQNAEMPESLEGKILVPKP